MKPRGALEPIVPPLVLAALLGAVVGLWFVRSLPWAAGLAGALAALTYAFSDRLLYRPDWSTRPIRWWGGEHSPASIARRLLPPALVVIVALFMMWPVSFGQPIVSNDHSVHAYKAWVMAEQLLPSGRLSGWSHTMFAGYPAGELYPPGAELWVSAFRWLTFGVGSFHTVYGLALTAFFVFAGLSVYRLGSHFFGRWTGAFAAIVFLLDPGKFRQGGWHYTIHYGVWPQVLGLAFVLLAIVRLDILLERRRVRDVLLFGFLAGYSILAHPMSLVTLALLAPLYVMLWWLKGNGRLRDVALPLAGAATLAALLAASWLLPFVARKDLTANIGVIWEPVSTVAKRFAEGRLFGETPAAATMLALLGMVFAVRERRPIGLFLVLSAVGLVFAATETAVVELDLLSLSGSFANLQYERFLTQAKPFWFILAAWGLVGGWSAWRDRRAATAAAPSGDDAQPSAVGGPRGRLTRAALAFIVAGALFCAGRPFATAFAFEYLSSHPTTPRKMGSWGDLKQAADWLRAQPPSDGLDRVALIDGEHTHELVHICLMAERPCVKVGYTPAEGYRFRANQKDWSLFRRLGVRWVVTKGPRRNRNIEEAAKFGGVHIYRLKNPTWAPYAMSGGGQAELERFENERLTLRLSGTREKSRLRVFVGYHPRWEATLNDAPVPIREVVHKRGKDPLHVLEIPARDGLLELRWVARGVDTVARASFAAYLLGSALLLLLCGVGPLRRRLWEPLAAGYNRHRATIGSVLVGVTVAGALAVAAAVSLGAAEKRADAARLFRISDHVADATVMYRGGGDLPLSLWDGERWTKGRKEANWRFVGTTVRSIDKVATRCVWAHPINGKTLEIAFEDVPLGESMRGFIAIEDRAVERHRSGKPVELTVRVNGDKLGTLSRENAKGAEPFTLATPGRTGQRGRVLFEIRSEKERWRNFCFDAWTTPSAPTTPSTDAEPPADGPTAGRQAGKGGTR